MTTTPAPRRGLFLCALFRTLRPVFRSMQPFLGVLRGRPGCIFFCANFSKLSQSFFIRLFPPFQPFSGGILRQFRRLFCAVFCFVCRPAGQDHYGQPEPEAGRDRAALFFYVRFCRVLGISQHPQSRTNRGRSGTRSAPMFVYAFPVFSCAFTVPFLCRHGCP